MAAGTIAVVTDSTAYGGSEEYLGALMSQLRGRWRFVAVLGDRAAEETSRRFAEAGAEVRTIPGLRRRPTPAAVLGTARALRDAHPALAHVNLTDQGDGLGPLMAARLSRRPVVATLHLVIPNRSRWRESVSRRSLSLPDLVVGVSESMAHYARCAGARTAVVLNGIVEPELAPEPRAALGLEAGQFIVGGIGRIDDQKGWDVLCRAASLVRRELPSVGFVVIGGGPALEQFRLDPSCADVRFVGYREHASALVRAFDVLALPSRYEGFGLAAVEAMYAGVPVVASDVGGLPEVVADCGVLVPPERPDLLASAIVDLVRDPAVRAEYAARAGVRARATFTAERMGAETSRVYESIAR